MDCGARGIAYMDQAVARNPQIPLQDLNQKIQVKVIDGKPIESGDITHIVKVSMKIQDHGEQLPILVTKLGHYPIVLRIHWLKLHDVAV
jgi:hypothetical protein